MLINLPCCRLESHRYLQPSHRRLDAFHESDVIFSTLSEFFALLCHGGYELNVWS
jgi:hypothetical protein